MEELLLDMKMLATKTPHKLQRNENARHRQRWAYPPVYVVLCACVWNTLCNTLWKHTLFRFLSKTFSFCWAWKNSQIRVVQQERKRSPTHIEMLYKSTIENVCRCNSFASTSAAQPGFCDLSFSLLLFVFVWLLLFAVVLKKAAATTSTAAFWQHGCIIYNMCFVCSFRLTGCDNHFCSNSPTPLIE